MMNIRVFPEEVTLLLQNLPREVANALTAKMESIFEELRAEAFRGTPGKYLAREQMESGVDVQGNLVIGYLSYADKGGVYSIAPKRYAFLFSKERQFFAHYVSAHPYPKGANWIESLLSSKKPWIEAQLTQAAEDAF